MPSNVLRSLFGRATRVVPDADTWLRHTADMPLLDGLDATERERLRELAAAFLQTKSIEAAGGARLDDPLELAIAVQACVPILNLGLAWYEGWHSVLVYPGDFMARQEYTDEDGVVHQVERALSGEAWPDGPVVLSLEGIAEGMAGEYADNLVIHEMAHKLDLSNGVANGMPALHVGMDREAWTGALSTAYEDLCTRVERGEEAPFDDYATEDPGEFFAVISEAFFVEPGPLADLYPEVYAQFTHFYRQDPCVRLASSGRR